MRFERFGVVLLVAGGVAILLALGLGWTALIVGAIALVALGIGRLALAGPWPLGGRLTRAALRLLAVGLAGFTAAALVINAHPNLALVDLGLVVAILASFVATAIGTVLIAMSAVRTIWGVRQTSEASGRDPGQGSGRRVRRIRRGVVALLAALMLVGLTGLATYVGAIGSDGLLHPTGNSDCRTPLVRYGWTYEAVNYDLADDAVLQGQNPNMTNCASQGATAGSDVVTTDGVRIAGWYIPAADGSGPTGVTVVLVHGWAANKSEVLRYAVPLHARFNVVAFDLRDGGRSARTESTFGLREKLDVEAIVDWLERTKHPAHIAMMGNSMGGGTAVLAAAGDQRIEALILDSTHAHVSDILDRRLEVDNGLPSLPGTPAILAGIWARSGLDLMDADPVAAIPALGHRPLLIVHGAADIHDLPARSADVNYRAAQDAGVPVELHMCPGATHGNVIDKCPTEWGQWVVGFLERVFGMSA